MDTLLHLPYSPWSERARWALDVKRLPHRRETYQPLLGEPALRLRLKRLRGTVTVPVLFTAEGPYTDSFDIAAYAERKGPGPALFPEESGAAIRRWNEFAERGLAAGRALSLARVRERDEALRELVPRPLRSALGRSAVLLARLGVDRTRRKYGAGERALDEHRAVLHDVLVGLRRALAATPAPARGPKTLLGGFSYADITIAQVLAFVSPHRGPYLRLGAANQAAYGDPILAGEFEDLVAWRDELYDVWRAAT
jgi:glutathione S-transferase